MIPFDSDLFARNRTQCQVVPVKIHQSREDEVFPETKDGFCVFLNRLTKQCAIYSDRPEVCRLFGSAEYPSLPCPHLMPSGKRRSRAGRRKIERNTINRMMKLLSIDAP
jgi:Fe-S-cluster containining protein